MKTVLEEIQKYRLIIKECIEAEYCPQCHKDANNCKCPNKAELLDGKTVGDHLKEYHYLPNEKENKTEYFKHGQEYAMDNFNNVLAELPDDSQIPVNYFAHILTKAKLQNFMPRDNGNIENIVKYKEIQRGANMVYRLIAEICPKVGSISKDELIALVSYIGEKELNWN